MTDPHEPIDEDCSGGYDFHCQMRELQEEWSDYNDAMARSHDEGWFYPDDD